MTSKTTEQAVNSRVAGQPEKQGIEAAPEVIERAIAPHEQMRAEVESA